ncbi:GIY-YIG nuclease family protein [Paraliobacillus ryukyuensis]|uniref:GIY-YIG nuclease family protein n=1 Tax=Paraliobacillus ryukyuensis TaxID=200904 RepID=UPI0009A614DB|nr:GIY-YIG nuclease family protein [Paraliobacillus ryukyuensis]
MVIYQIKNKINGRIYIGQTTSDFHKRKKSHIATALGEYKSAIKYPIHKAIAKYGVDNFEWEIIDTAKSREDLNKKEAFYIKKFKSLCSQKGYNIKYGGAKEKLPDMIKMKISRSQKGKLNHSYGKPSARRKQVRCINNNKTYKSVTDASSDLGLSISKIAAVCRGDRGSTGGYIFDYVDGSIDKKRFRNRTKKMIDKKSGIVFNSYVEARDYFKLEVSTINNYLIKYGYYKTDKFFLVPFENKDKVFDIDYDSNKKGIIILNETLNKKYPSIKQACLDINYKSYSNLALKLRENNGKCVFKGYMFSYFNK